MTDRVTVIINFPVNERERYHELLENFIVPKEDIAAMLLFYWSYLKNAPLEADNELQSYVVEFMFDGRGRKIISDNAVNLDAVARELHTTPTVVEDNLINHLYYRIRSAATKVIPLVERKVIEQMQMDPNFKHLGYMVPTEIRILPFGLSVTMSLTNVVLNNLVSYSTEVSHEHTQLPVPSNGFERWS
jgi:hypothetical protein